MKPVYVIDFSNFTYKFKSIYSFARVDVNGVLVDTSVLYGYLRALRQNIFSDIVIALDGIPSQSLNLLPEYKGQRVREASDNQLSVPRLELIKFLTVVGTLLNKNIKVVCSPLQEADQVISSMAHMVTKNLPIRWSFVSQLNTHDIYSDRSLRYLESATTSKWDSNEFDSIVIGTTDSDMQQLQRYQNVFIDSSTSGKVVSDLKSSKAVADLQPEAISIYKAIVGDVSDNVPPLDIKTKKDDVLYLLRENIHSYNEALQLKEAILKGGDCKPFDLLIKDILSHGQRFAFDRNWSVVNLEFYSVPIVLSFDDYDINSTLKKYKLKV